MASNEELEGKWNGMCGAWSWADKETDIWPNIIVSDGNEVASMMEERAQRTEWVVVDGGALHNSTTKRMTKARLQLWGVYKSVSVWTTRMEEDFVPHKHQSLGALASTLEIELQRRAVRSFYAVGGQRFKDGVMERDFNWDTVRSAFTTSPKEIWGEQCRIEEWVLQPLAAWPIEPTTSTRTKDEWQVHGIEVAKKETMEDRRRRMEDRKEWVKNGQLWWDAFTTEARRRVQRYMHDNIRATHILDTPSQGKQTSFGKVEDLYLEETDYRLGAQRAIWKWENGKCEEVIPKHVASEANYKIPNILQAATTLGFKDKEAIGWLTTWGTSHNTHDFPLCSYASRNHQGAAAQVEAITLMIKEKVNEGHFGKDTTECWTPTPTTIPFGIVPVNGTVQKPKEAEMMKKLMGNPYKENVRGTWDGSSPHDGRSPNDACELIPELNAKWVTIDDITQSMCVLMATGATVEIFKLDLRRAYTQLVVMNTQRWRQTVYWRWINDEGGKVGGYMQDRTAMWGMKHNGNAFFRTITQLTVRYVTRKLLEDWAPKLQCPFAKEWVKRRKVAGFNNFNDDKKTKMIPDNEQTMPAQIQGFLDDFWTMIASSIKSERESGRKIVLEAFEYLGWTLSTSKFEEEGTLATDAVLIGHHVCTKTQTRGVMNIKQERLRHSIAPMLEATRWDRKELSQVLGLAESVRGDVCRRWRLGPAYRVLHAGNIEEKWTRPSERAKACLKKVMETLSERRSLLWRPSRWTIPRNPTQRLIPNTDAAGQGGFGGCLWEGNIMNYFAGEWSDQIKNARVNIAVLEAWAVTMAAATWGPKLHGRKVIFRSDSSPTCYCLNKLWSGIEDMELLVNLWEDLQFTYHFEGLLVFCSGKTNTLADIASRIEKKKVEQALSNEIKRQGLGNLTLTRDVIPWNERNINIDIEDALIANWRKRQATEKQ